eukprot:SAG11_NODE_40212_length_207_cov_65.731481_1_plen_42_part_01
MLHERARKRPQEQEESRCTCKEIFDTREDLNEKSTLFEGANR